MLALGLAWLGELSSHDIAGLIEEIGQIIKDEIKSQARIEIKLGDHDLSCTKRSHLV